MRPLHSVLAIALISVLANESFVTAAGRTITVKEDSNGDLATIQKAVQVAMPGDVIEVCPGTYSSPNGRWSGRHGRDAWDVVFRTVRAGSPAAPITIKAKFPARQPLDRGDWAEGDARKETVLEGRPASGERLLACALLLHSYVVFDGFVICGGERYGVYGSRSGQSRDTAARGLWVRNCKFLTSGTSPTGRAPLGENYGSLTLSGWAVPGCCVQNNYFETGYCTALDIAGGTCGMVEYNEFRDWNSYAIYAHGGAHANDGLVVRYNYFHPKQRKPLMRLRDSLGYVVHHNVVTGGAGIYLDDHCDEHPDFPDDCYAAHHNTIVLEPGSQYAIGYQAATHPEGKERATAYNIIAGGPRLAVNLSPWGKPSRNVHVTNNVVAAGIELIGGKEQGLKSSSWIERDNVIADPQLDAHFKSHAFDNEKYGANLDVRAIPYRKHNGEHYPVHNPYCGSTTVGSQ